MHTDDIVRSKAETASEISTVKTVLVHIQNEETANQRIEAALAIARTTSAHISCLQVTPIEAYVAFDGFGGVFIMNDIMKAIDEGSEQLRRKVEEDLAREDASWDYVSATGNVASEIVRHAALADLVIVGREPLKNQLGAPAITLLGDLLERSRTPLFIPGSEPISPTGLAIIGWNGSHEAANAVRAAIGLLKIASEVRVVQVTRKGQEGEFPGTRIMEYLSRQGVSADLIVETSPAAAADDFVSASLIAHARARAGAYVVIGGYSRSRISEFLFGGVTRTMIAESTIPLLLGR